MEYKVLKGFENNGILQDHELAVFTNKKEAFSCCYKAYLTELKDLKKGTYKLSKNTELYFTVVDEDYNILKSYTIKK